MVAGLRRLHACWLKRTHLGFIRNVFYDEMAVDRMYWFCMAGVATSVLLPVLAEAVKRYFPASPRFAALAAFPQRFPEFSEKFWVFVKPYLVLGAFSGLTAIVLYAFAGEGLRDWRTAFLLGYAWDSTLQRIVNK